MVGYLCPTLLLTLPRENWGVGVDRNNSEPVVCMCVRACVIPMAGRVYHQMFLAKLVEGPPLRFTRKEVSKK